MNLHEGQRTEITQKVIDLIAYKMDKRDVEGIKEYGQSMDEVPFDSYKWNDMVIEELVDGIKYIAKENERLKEQIDKLAESVDTFNMRLVSEVMESNDPVKDSLLLRHHMNNFDIIKILRGLLK